MTRGTPARVDDDVSEARSGHVLALKRGLDVLDMFDRDTPVVSIGEIATRLGLHKSSASRIAATLAAADLLRTTAIQGQYRLGPRLVRLGALAEADSTIDAIVMPFLRDLAQATGETGHLAVLDGRNVLTIGVVDGWHTVRMQSWVGKTSAACLTSTGKALLAGVTEATVLDRFHDPLPQSTERSMRTVDELIAALRSIRRQGYATDIDELEIGLRCVAAPVFDVTGAVVASISVSGPSQRLSLPAIKRVAEHVRWTASTASRALGASRAPYEWCAFPVAPPAPLDWVEQARATRSAP